MQKILSIILSFTLLFNALAPSFAGVPRKYRLQNWGARRINNAYILQKVTYQKAVNVRFQQRLLKWRESIPSLSQISANVAKKFSARNFEGLGREILTMPRVDRTLMRNELVALFLVGELSPEQRGQALSYFQESLADAKEILGAAVVPEKYLITEEKLAELGFTGDYPSGKYFGFHREIEGEDLEVEEFFETRLMGEGGARNWIEQDPAVNAALDLLADAAALSVMGGEKDIPSLVELYEASIGTPFEPMAGKTVLYALLRLKLYDRLATFFDNPNYPFGRYITDFKYSTIPQELRDSFHEPSFRHSHNIDSPSEFYDNLQTDWADELEEAFNEEMAKRGPFAEMVTRNNKYQDLPSVERIDLQPDLEAIQKEGIQNMDMFPLDPPTQVIPSSVEQRQNLDVTEVVPVLTSASEPEVESSEDISPTLRSVPSISVRGTRFKFAMEDAEGEKAISNVNITISEGIKAAEFSRVTISQDGIIELRGAGQEDTPMSRFYFQFSPENGALDTLIKGMQDFPRNTLHLKLISNKTNSVAQEISKQWNKLAHGRVTLASIPLYDSSKAKFAIAWTDTSLLPKECVERGLDGILVVRDDQVFYEDDKGTYLLKDFYIRLPKEFRNIWAPIMQNNPQQDFSLTVFPTHDKTFIMKYIVPLLQVGTGKAFGPIMSALGLPLFWANGIPLVANNGMPVILSPLMLSLRKYGDANIYRAGIGLYFLSAFLALSLGLNGFMGVENASPVQVGGLIAALLGMGVANVLTRTNQNNLLVQNLGKIETPKAKKQKWVSDHTQEPTIGFLFKRFKEVLTKKPTEERDTELFQTAAQYKNLGTGVFLAFPFLFNMAAKALGSSARADFSLSFWLLGGVSLYALYQAFKLPLKDTFIRNPQTLERLLRSKEYELLPAAVEELIKPQEEQDLTKIAKELNKIISPLAQAMSFKTQVKEEDICEGLEWNSVISLGDFLRQEGFTEKQVSQFEAALKEQFDSLSRRNVKYSDVTKTPKMKSALLGMALATTHELGTSIGLAYAINQAIAKGGVTGNDNLAFGAFLAAVFMYGFTFYSRGLGKKLIPRMSEGSMYLFSSLCSLVGTGLMIGADGNFVPLLTGAVLTGFGTGNFFSQVYKYTVSLNDKYRPEIAMMISWTMPVAAFLSALVEPAAAVTGIQGFDLMLCAGALVGSLVATKAMFADSSIVSSAKYYWKKLTNIFKKNEPPAEDYPATEEVSEEARQEELNLRNDLQQSLPIEEDIPEIPSKYRAPVHG